MRATCEPLFYQHRPATTQPISRTPKTHYVPEERKREGGEKNKTRLYPDPPRNRKKRREKVRGGRHDRSPIGLMAQPSLDGEGEASVSSIINSTIEHRGARSI